MCESVDDLPQINEDVYWKDFDYPIDSFLSRTGAWSYEPVIGEDENKAISEEDMLNYNQFEKVYYVVPGISDEVNWRFLIKHKNGFFVFFDAGCDYTGFDCCGGGTITYGKDPRKMWSLGLTDEMRKNVTKK